jgi:hypothetical protein
MNSLESRLLLSRQVTFPDGSSFIFPLFMHLPRTGGALIQSGTALTLGVGQRTSNTVNITNQGSGAESVEWNGRAAHEVPAVQAILVQAAGSRHDQITINLVNSTAMAVASAPTATGFAKAVSHPIHVLSRPRTGGTAVQTGSVLTITVTSRKINTVAVESWNHGQMVEAHWNGGVLQTFSGVDTIIVDIRNSTNDFVALDNAVAKGP